MIWDKGSELSWVLDEEEDEGRTEEKVEYGIDDERERAEQGDDGVDWEKCNELSWSVHGEEERIKCDEEDEEVRGNKRGGEEDDELVWGEDRGGKWDEEEVWLEDDEE